MHTKNKLTLITSPAVLGLTAMVFAADHPAASVGAEAALAKLKEGNDRFTGSKVSEGKPTASRRAETAQGQHPFAIIVGCAIPALRPNSCSTRTSATCSWCARPAISSMTTPWAASNTRSRISARV
jgi:hypothetical protein